MRNEYTKGIAMTKYKLKKDTPIAKAGELFDIDPEGDLLTKDDGACFSIYSIQDLDDWFEKVGESIEWLHDGASYYQPAVNVLTKKFVPSYNEYWGDAHDEARRHIGICYKSREACQRFINFLTAVEVVSHDEGFMKQDKTYGKVWELRRAYLGSEKFFTARIFAVGFHNPGAFYFDTEEHAIASGEKHHNEWQTILDYDWSKGEDDEEDNED